MKIVDSIYKIPAGYKVLLNDGTTVIYIGKMTADEALADCEQAYNVKRSATFADFSDGSLFVALPGFDWN